MILFQNNLFSGLNAPPTWELNISPRHSRRDNATFIGAIVRFIIEYVEKTDMSFKQGVLEKAFSHLLLNESMPKYFKICRN